MLIFHPLWTHCKNKSKRKKPEKQTKPTTNTQLQEMGNLCEITQINLLIYIRYESKPVNRPDYINICLQWLCIVVIVSFKYVMYRSWQKCGNDNYSLFQIRKDDTHQRTVFNQTQHRAHPWVEEFKFLQMHDHVLFHWEIITTQRKYLHELKKCSKKSLSQFQPNLAQCILWSR